MGELLERNGLRPSDIVNCIFTMTPDLDAEFPAVAARAIGFERVPLLCVREIDVPGALERVIRVLVQYHAGDEHQARHVYLREAKVAARRPGECTVIEDETAFPNVVHGDGYSTAHLDDLGEGYGFRQVRRGLGISAFGANAIVLPPRYEASAHLHEQQEELYFVHAGQVEMEFGDGTRRSRSSRAASSASIRRRSAASATSATRTRSCSRSAARAATSAATASRPRARRARPVRSTLRRGRRRARRAGG